MKAFGIEIRQANTVGNLFKDVDKVLAVKNIEPGKVSGELQVQTVAHALQVMMQPDKFFSICTIDNCMKVSGIVVSKERYDVYRTLHCINWNQMLPDYRQTIVAMVLDDFRSILNPI